MRVGRCVVFGNRCMVVLRNLSSAQLRRVSMYCARVVGRVSHARVVAQATFALPCFVGWITLGVLFMLWLAACCNDL